MTGLPRASSRQTGESSLLYASHYGHLDIVKALLESRADVNAKNNVQTPPGPLPLRSPSGPLPYNTRTAHTREAIIGAMQTARAGTHTVARYTSRALRVYPRTPRIPALACCVGRIHCAADAAARRWAWPGPGLSGPHGRAGRAEVPGRA